MAYYIGNKCIGCGMCLRSCPVQAISGGLKEKHIIDAGICIECGACTTACNMKAIRNSDGIVCEKPNKEEILKPLIDKDKCTFCRLCIINCVTNSLEISEPTHNGDISLYSKLKQKNNCTGCGMCEKVCPQKAITMTVGEVE